MPENETAIDKWFETSKELPPVDCIVDTKIDDADGERNLQSLKLIANGGRLWFLPDGSMYVYYTPTHWRYGR